MRTPDFEVVDMLPAKFAQAVTIQRQIEGAGPSIHVGIVYGADEAQLDRHVGAIIDQYGMINGAQDREVYRVSFGPVINI